MPTVEQLLAAAENDEKVPQVTDDIRDRQHATAVDLVLNEVSAKARQYPGVGASRLEELVTSCPYFELVKQEYPLVLNKAVNNPDEIPTLKRMVDLIRAVELGQHTQHSASVAAGTLLKQKYIDPVVEAATPSPRAKLSYSAWKRQNDL